METVSRTEDIETGSDLSFERRWWRIQRVCWVVLGLLLAGGVAGLFGHGPLSEATADAAGGGVHVRYQRVARRETPALLTVRLAGPALASGSIRLRLTRTPGDRMQLKQVIPAPLSTEPLADGVRFTFAADPTLDSAVVVFVESPTTPGVVEGEVAVEGTPPVRFRQFIYP